MERSVEGSGDSDVSRGSGLAGDQHQHEPGNSLRRGNCGNADAVLLRESDLGTGDG